MVSWCINNTKLSNKIKLSKMTETLNNQETSHALYTVFLTDKIMWIAITLYIIHSLFWCWVFWWIVKDK